MSLAADASGEIAAIWYFLSPNECLWMTKIGGGGISAPSAVHELIILEVENSDEGVPPPLSKRLLPDNATAIFPQSSYVFSCAR